MIHVFLLIHLRRNRLDSTTDSSKTEDGYTSDASIARHGYKLIEEEKSNQGKVTHYFNENLYKAIIKYVKWSKRLPATQII